MNVVFTVGRIALVALFVVSAAAKLMDVTTTSAELSRLVTIPDALTGIVVQIETATNMTRFNLLAIAIGVIELIAALLIVFNIGARGAALVLMIFVFADIYFNAPFWTHTGPARDASMQVALRDLSILGGLLIIFAIGPRRLWLNGRMV